MTFAFALISAFMYVVGAIFIINAMYSANTADRSAKFRQEIKEQSMKVGAVRLTVSYSIAGFIICAMYSVAYLLTATLIYLLIF